MTYELLVAFLMYALATASTPGPNNLMAMTSGLNYGMWRTMPFVLGAGFGFSLMVFLAGMGLLSLLDYVPFAYDILRGFCVVYLLYLAWKIATAKPLDMTVSTQKPNTFWHAVAFQWVNPKSLVMAMAAVTTYIPESSNTSFIFNVGMITVLYGLIAFSCTSLWALCGTAFRRFLKNPIYYRIFNVSMAILLVASLYPMLNQIEH